MPPENVCPDSEELWVAFGWVPCLGVPSWVGGWNGFRCWRPLHRWVNRINQLVHQLVHLLVHQVVHLLVHQLPLQHTPVWKRIRFYSNILKIDPDQMLILCHVTFQNHTIHLNQYYQAKWFFRWNLKNSFELRIEVCRPYLFGEDVHN